MTGRPNDAKRSGSPLALRTRHSHCGARRAMTRARIVLPAISRNGLSPPPIRRAKPPASTTPAVQPNSLVTIVAFSRVTSLDAGSILVECDPLLARQRDKAFADGLVACTGDLTLPEPSAHGWT